MSRTVITGGCAAAAVSLLLMTGCASEPTSAETSAPAPTVRSDAQMCKDVSDWASELQDLSELTLDESTYLTDWTMVTTLLDDLRGETEQLATTMHDAEIRAALESAAVELSAAAYSSEHRWEILEAGEHAQTALGRCLVLTS